MSSTIKQQNNIQEPVQERTLNDRHQTSTIIVASIFAVVVCLVFICICCSYLKKRKRNPHALFPETPIVVTSATHTAPGGYPVPQMPVGGTTTTTAYQTQVYATPYPPQGPPTQMPMPMPAGQPAQMPMPMPMPAGQTAGAQPYMAPYPSMPAAANMNPPSYEMAVGGAGSGAATNATYEKQSPYNPNYSGQ
ncbi:protein shisa-5 isoform X2 [Stomoxys calcitrans]|uniref:Uncharacterized protein n=1 Tax=Stomoxys calcitrans TaxID=35570 RepID=A0A1I8QDJ7_STOCA|nr:protein shisa-5 isoform X2 [Stomoxys calcitrans]